MAIQTQGEWQWWAGHSEDDHMRVGPCDTRDQAIKEAIADGFGEYLVDPGAETPVWRNLFIVLEARNDPIRLADWIGAEDALNYADERIADSDRVSFEYDDGAIFIATAAQEADLRERLKRACDEWQEAHDLTFECCTFSHSRNAEAVDAEALRNAPETPANPIAD
jgi:hypothetical protein